MDDTDAGRYATEAPDREAVAAMPGPAVLEFGTDWCGHCVAARPFVEQALSAAPGVRHLKIEDGPGRPLGRAFRIKLWPTLVFLRDGIRRFTVVPGLLDGLNSYASRIGDTVYAVLGTPTIGDGDAIAYPADPQLALLVHEFHHACMNPWVDAHADVLLPAATRAFEVVQARLQALAQGPQLERLVPAAGARVAAGEAALELHFDRPMDGRIAIFGDVPPVVGKPAWDEARRVLRIPVRLEAGARYLMRLNGEDGAGFASADGEPLAPREWAFEVEAAAP